MSTDEVTLASVQTSVDGLRDLFHRRLVEDKAKNRLYEELFHEMTFVRDELVGQFLTPMIVDIVRILDRLDTPGADALVTSVVAELEEALERQGVMSVLASGTFDPTVHDMAGLVESGHVPGGDIVECLRPGYTLGGKTVRPALVTVARTLREAPGLQEAEDND
ncbi:nucleotide exchange factor GrpE [Corynebacterium variabile]|uniref:nucleotide exchange factor GrpE n=1 Tax=Corynebacterium variabile TaxID=1727 RepID=UPI003A8D9EC9